MSLERRRALMGAHMEDLSLVYEIKNRPITAGTSINTQVQFMRANTPGSILLDITIDSFPNGTNLTAGVMKLIVMWDSSLSKAPISLGVRNITRRILQVGLYENWIDLTNITKANGSRYKFALIHNSDSNTLTVKAKKDSDAVYAFSVTGTYAATTSKLFLGATGAQSLPDGTLHLCKVYERILQGKEIDSFFE